MIWLLLNSERTCIQQLCHPGVIIYKDNWMKKYADYLWKWFIEIKDKYWLKHLQAHLTKHVLSYNFNILKLSADSSDYLFL